MDDTFTANGSDGEEYTVRIYRTRVTASTPLGTEFVPGEPDLITTCGHRVMRLKRGWYRIEGTGVILMSESRDAP